MNVGPQRVARLCVSFVMTPRRLRILSWFAPVLLLAGTFSLRLPNRTQLELARSTVEGCYQLAQAGDYESMGYGVDSFGCREPLKDLEAAHGKLRSFRVTKSGWTLNLYDNARVTASVEREHGRYVETWDMRAGYTRSYSRDYASVSRINAVPE